MSVKRFLPVKAITDSALVYRVALETVADKSVSPSVRLQAIRIVGEFQGKLGRGSTPLSEEEQRSAADMTVEEIEAELLTRSMSYAGQEER